MVYKYVSVKQIIAKLYRDLGNWNDLNHYDILEWIGEVIAQIGSRDTYYIKHTIAKVTNYRLELPCDLVSLLMVEHDGCRLRHSAYVGDLTQLLKKHDSLNNENEVYWQSEIETHIFFDEEGNEIKRLYDQGQFMNKLRQVKIKDTTHSYKKDGTVLKFSFEEDYVTLHYLAIPLDEENFPLIPDNTSLSEAILYRVLLKMAGQGKSHPIISQYGYENLRQMYHKYLGWALGELGYPSPDMVETYIQKLTDLMPTYSNWINAGAFNEQDYNRIASTKKVPPYRDTNIL